LSQVLPLGVKGEIDGVLADGLVGAGDTVERVERVVVELVTPSRRQAGQFAKTMRAQRFGRRLAPPLPSPQPTAGRH
jgi:hypothetical protein